MTITLCIKDNFGLYPNRSACVQFDLATCTSLRSKSHFHIFQESTITKHYQRLLFFTQNGEQFCHRKCEINNTICSIQPDMLLVLSNTSLLAHPL